MEKIWCFLNNCRFTGVPYLTYTSSLCAFTLLRRRSNANNTLDSVINFLREDIYSVAISQYCILFFGENNYVHRSGVLNKDWLTDLIGWLTDAYVTKLSLVQALVLKSKCLVWQTRTWDVFLYSTRSMVLAYHQRCQTNV